MVIRRKFSREFKLAAVARVRAGESAAAVARAMEVNANEVQRWWREWEEYGDRAFLGFGQKRDEEDHTAELERNVSRNEFKNTPDALQEGGQLGTARPFQSLRSRRRNALFRRP